MFRDDRSFTELVNTTSSIITLPAGALLPSQNYSFVLQVARPRTVPNATLHGNCPMPAVDMASTSQVLLVQPEVVVDDSVFSPPLVSIDPPTGTARGQSLRVVARVVSRNTPPSPFVLEWTDETAATDLNNPFILQSQPGSSSLVLKPFVLLAGTYTFRLRATELPPSPAGVTSFAEVTFTVTDAPIPGSISISPTNGVVLQTLFNLSAQGWEPAVAGSSLTYTYARYAAMAPSPTPTEVVLTTASVNPFQKVVLPEGLWRIVLYVQDDFGATARAVSSSIINVTGVPANITELIDLVDNSTKEINDSSSPGNYDRSLQLTIILSGVFCSDFRGKSVVLNHLCFARSAESCRQWFLWRG